MPPIPRRALFAALGALALTGCTARPGLPPIGPDTADADGSATAPGAAPATTVGTAMGPVTVPGTPLRVVTLDTAELDSALTLGITPVGAARTTADPAFPSYWPASRLAPIAPVGTVGEPHLAAIRALRPDLVLGNRERDGARYDRLREIAPTVLTQSTGPGWKADFQLHAQALGRQAAAAAFVGSYQRHVAQVAQALSAVHADGRRISLVRFTEGGAIHLYGRQSFPGTLLTDLGLPRPDAQNTDRPFVEVPPDQLAAADGDLLLYAAQGDPGRTAAAAVRSGPAWQALAAVRAHRAFPVDDRLWFQGIGYTGANAVLAELQHFLGA
ncbi:ABC transporter substrate-binding protein [Kitasatospora sp. NPDC054939]